MLHVSAQQRVDWDTWFQELQTIDADDRGLVMHDCYCRSFVISHCDLNVILTSDSYYVRKDGYVSITIGGKKDLLHRVLMKVSQSDIHVDHRNRQRNDCRRANLRLATLTENNRNHGRHKDNTSGFIGVSFVKSRNKWQAGIGLNGTRKALGRYETAEDAARAYDRAARLYYGEFANLNFGETND